MSDTKVNPEAIARRQAFEDWYTLNAFDLSANPIGGYECHLQWQAWMAASRAAPSPSLGEQEALRIVAKHRREVELSPGVGADKQRYAIACLDDVRNELERLSAAAQGQKPVAIPMSVHEAAQACVDNFLPTTAHPTFKDGLLRKIEQYFVPLFASPVPASGEGVPHGFALVPTDYLVCAAWWLNHFMRSAPDHGDTVVNSLSVRLSELAAAPKVAE